MQTCTICHGTGTDQHGRACPYTDVHRAAARFPKKPMNEQTQTELAAARQRIAYLEDELRNQQTGACLYIAAIVERAVGVGVTMTLSELDMVRAYDLILERGEPADGGMAVRVLRETAVAAEPDKKPAIITEMNPVLAKAHQPIILLDTALPPGG